MRGLSILVLAAATLSAADSTGWISHAGGKAERDTAGRIVAVNLRGSWVNDEEMSHLCELPDLEKLDLSHTRISDEGLLRLKSARRITDLSLFYSEWITDQGLTAIRDWKQLKRLNLRGTRISDATLEVVSHITGLEALDIANTAVTDNGLDHLITLVNLKELSLGRGRLTNSALELLRMFPTLTYLDLSGARPEPPDMAGRRRSDGSGIPEEALRSISELKELRVLKLGYSSITGPGLRILSALDKIEKLGIEGCRRIDDRAAAGLINWKSLKYLDLQDTAVTAEGLARLRGARPDLRVLWLAKKAAE